MDYIYAFVGVAGIALGLGMVVFGGILNLRQRAPQIRAVRTIIGLILLAVGIACSLSFTTETTTVAIVLIYLTALWFTIMEGIKISSAIMDVIFFTEDIRKYLRIPTWESLKTLAIFIPSATFVYLYHRYIYEGLIK